MLYDLKSLLYEVYQSIIFNNNLKYLYYWISCFSSYFILFKGCLDSYVKQYNNINYNNKYYNTYNIINNIYIYKLNNNKL